MTRFQRIKSFISGLLSMLIGLILILSPEDSGDIVLGILSFVLTVYGINILTYYFTMARFMVNGRLILFKGLIVLDLGLFSGSLVSVPDIYILLYLAIIHAFSGLVEILRSAEAIKFGAKNWKLKFSHGLIDLILAICCIAFFKHGETVAIVFGVGIVYSGMIRIISAFRRTTFVYIQ